MSKIETTKQSFWTQKNNNAVYGYFPTPLYIVEMEMNLIDFSMASPDVQITMADFTGGEGEQLHCMHEIMLQKGLKPLSYYNEITDIRYDECKKRYSGVEGFYIMDCPCDFKFMKLRNKTGKVYSKECIAVLRNNPPYGIWDDFKGEKVLSEELFFVGNTPYNVPGGIMIFEVPLDNLIRSQNLIKKITYRYESVQIFKFPEEVFKKFNQVVVVGKRKRKYSNDIELAESLRESLKRGQIQYLNEVNEPVIALEPEALKKIKAPNIFRDGRVNDGTLTNGLNELLDDLLEAEKKQDLKVLDVLSEKPLIEKGAGHISQEMASGKYNGIMGNCLIRGGTLKDVEVHQYKEGDADVTEEVEILKPFVEITTKSGRIVFKDY